MHSLCEQVKAWCYYESRLLGAHHGLISTYALETMVLYIFNLYHTQLHSPLRVHARAGGRAHVRGRSTACHVLQGTAKTCRVLHQVLGHTRHAFQAAKAAFRD